MLEKKIQSSPYIFLHRVEFQSNYLKIMLNIKWRAIITKRYLSLVSVGFLNKSEAVRYPTFEILRYLFMARNTSVAHVSGNEKAGRTENDLATICVKERSSRGLVSFASTVSSLRRPMYNAQSQKPSLVATQARMRK